MKPFIDTQTYQVYPIPTIMITYDRRLNGNYEVAIRWWKWIIGIQLN